MGAEMAMALADLIRGGELRRLKICAAPDCEPALFVSRNRSKIFCDTGNCGNRQHVAATGNGAAARGSAAETGAHNGVVCPLESNAGVIWSGVR